MILLKKAKIIVLSLKKILERKYNFDLREWGYLKMSTFIKKNFNNEFNIITDKTGINITSL